MGKYNATTTKEVRLFGMGCNLSRTFMSNIQAAADDLEMNLKVEEVSDIQEMLALGITAIPALQIGDEVVVSGKVPDVDDLKALLQSG
jgi:hypothetical protein